MKAAYLLGVAQTLPCSTLLLGCGWVHCSHDYIHYLLHINLTVPMTTLLHICAGFDNFSLYIVIMGQNTPILCAYIKQFETVIGSLRDGHLD